MNDNYHLLDKANNAPAFDAASDSYDLYFDDWQRLDLLDNAALRDWQRLPRWARAQFEKAFQNQYTAPCAAPAIERLNYVSERSDGGYITTASLQPHHRENDETERADIFYIDGALASAEDWHLPAAALRHRPIILAQPGEHVLAARTALESALYGERCGWVDVGNDMQGWKERLKRFELILPKRIWR